jgi:hypothetical protein
VVGEACGTRGRGEKVYNVLVGNPEGRRPLGRPRRRWEDGIRMELRKIGWDAEWINLAHDLFFVFCFFKLVSYVNNMICITKTSFEGGSLLVYSGV